MPDYKPYTYDPHRAFRQVTWGAKSKILEVELQEMQQITREQRAALTNSVVTDGILADAERSIELVSGTTYKITVAAGFQAIMGGELVSISEPMVLTIDINFSYSTMFYLAAWDEVITPNSTIYKDGNRSGGTVIPNDLIDSRFGVETSQRVQRVVQLMRSPSELPVPSSEVKLLSMGSIHGSSKTIDTVNAVYAKAADVILADYSRFAGNGLADLGFGTDPDAYTMQLAPVPRSYKDIGFVVTFGSTNPANPKLEVNDAPAYPLTRGDGTPIKAGELVPGAPYFFQRVYEEEQYRLVGSLGGGTSEPDMVWTTRKSAADNSWQRVCYGNGVFVAIANTGTGTRLMTSSDGSTWTSRTVPDSAWQHMCYGNGLFVAVADSDTSNVMTSYDGINWNVLTVPNFKGRAVGYGNGRFVAYNTANGAPKLLTSTDGFKWDTVVVSDFYNINDFAYGNGRFVAMTDQDYCYTSLDGLSWTNVPLTTGIGFKSVTYGNGLFVAVGMYVNDSYKRIMYSPDGTNWTYSESPGTNSWYGVTYGNGLFVAVSPGGTGNRVMTSPDGINWTLGKSAADNNWVSVAYGNGMFTAVAVSGTGNRVMTSGFANPDISKLYNMRPKQTSEVLITGTTAQTVLSAAPTPGMVGVAVYFRVTGGSTNVRVDVSYTDAGGAQTLTLMPSQSFAVGSYTVPVGYVHSASGAIQVKITANVANRVYVTSAIID